MKLNEVVPWGRNLEEYKLMFKLSEADLKLNILGCGDGPASFNCEMTARGYSVVSFDPIYGFSSQEIQQRIEQTYDLVIGQVRQNAERYVWKNYQNVEDLGRSRLHAMQNFLQDFEFGLATERYLPESLPKLNFKDNQFQLCLCSHLLFLYSEQLSLSFHLTSIRELLRVASEVRIFPLLTLDGQKSPYLEQVQDYFTLQGITVEIETVSYEFQKGGNQMMRLLQ